MSGKTDELIDLVMNENVSAIQILVDRLEITSDEVIDLINELLAEGKLNGTMTEDSKRFFKSDVKISDAPTIAREESPPDFLSFNTRPAIMVSSIGFIVVAAGIISNLITDNIIGQNLAAILILIGLFIAFAGLYRLSQRKTPS